MPDRTPPPSIPFDHPYLLAARRLFPPALWPRLFVVGGTARDLVSGAVPNDLDLVAAVAAGDLAALGFRPVATTQGAAIHFKYRPGVGKVEIVLIPAPEALADDLRRRDFTATAFALPITGGAVYDPLDGVTALHRRLLIPTSPESFRDDPIRLFRAFRLLCAGWTLSPAAVALIQAQGWEAALARCPVERFSGEMVKALAFPAPQRFFAAMLEFDVGQSLLPELFRMPAVVAGPPEYHPEGDLFSHALETLAAVTAQSAEPLARFCGFFHDLGKLATDPALYPRHHGHEEAGAALALTFCQRLRLPAVWRTALAALCRDHGKARRWDELRDGTRVTLAEAAVKAGTTELLPLLVACDGGRGGVMPGWETAVAAARLSSRELGIRPEQFEGDAAAGIPPLTPTERQGLVHQARVAELRRRLRGESPPPSP
ncbi:MAG: hypothetical protein A2091_13200 [Desulfuromonadales bacterium GWD2_61_12]|nr:MAG: hypothetical protein A2005_03710 [Desulfuromonadales bacterium GWC2_61_20]OGR35494.1 MAG: hypothetical protein A2091_13200 [Desulfuromonadales bacterium GWD2_61_12]HAD04587.1 hypothetical protein [Desulfuromonas sp.]HBT83176.1 hypothetical protein [Desulfuromonas sp.]